MAQVGRAARDCARVVASVCEGRRPRAVASAAAVVAEAALRVDVPAAAICELRREADG